MKRCLAGVLALVAALSLTACDANLSIEQAATAVYPQRVGFEDYETRGAVREKNTVSDSTISAVKDFSYTTAEQLFSATNANSCYSPISLYYALSLAAVGAGGETQKELLSLLGVSDINTLSTECGKLYRLLYTDNEISKLRIANSLWMDNEMNGEPIRFKDSYIDNAVRSFYASLFTVDFSDMSAGQAMGQWIRDNTNGTLSADYDVDPEQIMSILNTVYYYDEWVASFNVDKTQAGTFYLEDGSTTICDFMNMIQGSHAFSKGEGYTRSSLNLKDKGQMVFILPDENISIFDLIDSGIEEMFEGGESNYGEVVWSVPKFGCDSEFKLAGMLKSLGVTSAFNMDADFSGITDHLAFISDITQKTHISVNEKGVEASAFTQIDYAGSSLPQDRAEMILNRPFLYGITTVNGTLLFIGVCIDTA